MHNIDAEKRLLSVLLNNPEIYPDLRDRLEEADFFGGDSKTPNFQKVFSTIAQVIEERGSLAPLNLQDRSGFSPKTWQWFIDLNVPVEEVDYLVRLVQNERTRREIMSVGSGLMSLARSEEEMAEVIARAGDISQKLRTLDRQSPVEPSRIRSVAGRYMEAVEKNREIDAEQRFISTPYIDLEALLGGLMRTKLYMIGARPAMGKSSMLADFREHALRRNKRVVTYTLEMSEQEVLNRHISRMTGIPTKQLSKYGYLGVEEDEIKIYKALNEIMSWDWYILDTLKTGRNMRNVRQTALSILNSTGDINLIELDYMQLVWLDGRSDRVREVDQIVYMLVDLAKEADTPVVVASQLSRKVEERQDKRPVLSDLRDSGSLEMAPDVIIFLYRDEYYNPNTEKPNITEADVAKHRDGPTGVVELYWDGPKTTFRNLKKGAGGLF